MSTKLVKYEDIRKIKNGTTTIIYGTTVVEPSGILRTDLSKFAKDFKNLLTSGYETRGVAKLSPEDTYDELSGVIVASKKAERVGIRVVKRNLKTTIKSMQLLLDDLKAELSLIEHREEVLKQDKH